MLGKIGFILKSRSHFWCFSVKHCTLHMWPLLLCCYWLLCYHDNSCVQFKLWYTYIVGDEKKLCHRKLSALIVSILLSRARARRARRALRRAFWRENENLAKKYFFQKIFFDKKSIFSKKSILLVKQYFFEKMWQTATSKWAKCAKMCKNEQNVQNI